MRLSRMQESVFSFQSPKTNEVVRYCRPHSLEDEFGLAAGAVAAQQMHDQRADKYSQEDKKEDLGNAGCSEGYAAKSKEPCDQRHDQENQRVIEHVFLLAPWDSCARVRSFSVQLDAEDEYACGD